MEKPNSQDFTGPWSVLNTPQHIRGEEGFAGKTVCCLACTLGTQGEGGEPGRRRTTGTCKRALHSLGAD